MKNGFTLLELMFVVVIISVASAGAIINFGNIDKDTEKKDTANIYKQVQKSAVMYLEIDDNVYNSFMSSKNTAVGSGSPNEVFISYDMLKSSNYFSSELSRYTGLKGNYYIRIFVDKDTPVDLGIQPKEFLNTCLCLIEISGSNVTKKTIANSEGEKKDICLKNASGSYDSTCQEGSDGKWYKSADCCG